MYYTFIYSYFFTSPHCRFPIPNLHFAYCFIPTYLSISQLYFADDSDQHCFELQLTHLLADHPDVSLYSPCLLSIQEETLDMVLPFTNTARLQLYELLKKLALVCMVVFHECICMCVSSIETLLT